MYGTYPDGQKTITAQEAKILTDGQLAQPAAWRAPELAIVVPTLNERPNIVPLLERLRNTLTGVMYEVVFVDDDSSDGTSEAIREISQMVPNVRVVQRIGRRGLASACIEGMLATSAPYLAVMDGDLQHDESVLPRMWEKIRSGQYDLVIGSRNVVGGSMGEFSRARVALSNLGLRVSRLVSKHDLSDPMSGFFVLTREFLNRVVRRTTGVGFKILLDLVASSPTPVRIAEVPFTFRNRLQGESKLDINVGLEYLYLVADKLIGRWLPIRFILFCLVGTVGVGLHLGVLYLLYRVLGASFGVALLIAIGIAMIVNFTINNATTYRDQRRRGWGFLSGLFFFILACSVGSLCNYAIAQTLLSRGVWWLLAGFCGLAVGSVWNFAVSSVLTWRVRNRN
jgi:dolichol-phosphate mannosyltransferase